MYPNNSTAIFQHNNEMLKRRFPDVYAEILKAGRLPFETTIFKTAKGHVNIDCSGTFGRLPWYNTDDIPGQTRASMAEWRLAGNDYLICLGLGLGYQALMAVDAFQKQPSHGRPGIVVFERSPAMFRIVMHLMDLRRLLSYDGLQLHVGDGFRVDDVIDRMAMALFLGKQRVVSDAASRKIFGAPFLRLERDVLQCLGATRDLWHTVKELGPEIFTNTVQNLPTLFTGQTLGSVRGALRGLPAVCVAAGPSLDAAIPWLKAIGNRAVIMAVDSAIPALVSAGIRPHMVVTADVRDINIRKFRAYLDDLRDAILVYAVESNPDNVRMFLGARKLAVSINNPILNRWLGLRWDLQCALPAMATVTHAAVFSAMELGADPIVFVGMDMAFPDGQSHAVDAMHHYQLSPEAFIPVAGVSGRPVQTDRPLNNYRVQLERVITRRHEQFINTSFTGARIAGTTSKSLQEVCQTLLPCSLDVSSRLNRIDWKPVRDWGEIARELHHMRDALEDFIMACGQGRGLINGAAGHGDAAPVGRSDTIDAFINRFNGKYRDMLDLLWGTQLKGFRRAERRRTQDSPPVSGTASLWVDGKPLSVWRAFFDSHENSAVAFQTHLKSICPFFEYMDHHSREMSANFSSRPGSTMNALDTAGFLAGMKEVQKAEACYLQHVRRWPADVTAWRGLIGMYVRFNLWKPAAKAIDRAMSTGGGRPKSIP